MVIAALSLLLIRPSALTEQLDALAGKRDAEGIAKYVAPGAWKGRNPLTVLKTNGAYETGKFGWHAIEGSTPDGKKYVVLSTPLTSEDIGERLFETDGSKLTKYIEEGQDYGWRIERHSLFVRLDIDNKKVAITDAFKVRHEGESGPLVFRMGPNYEVKSIKLSSTAADIGFTQIGGIVFVHEAKDGDTLVVNYGGVVDKPNYAGAITPTEAMLTNDYWYPMIGRKPSPFDIAVSGPKDWTAVAQGELVETVEQADHRITKYKMDLPCSYWSLNVAPYKVFSKTVDGRKFTVWSKTLTDAQMELQTDLYPPILKTYENFAKFPFSGYGAVVTPLYGGGALEAYSFATYGYYPGEDSHEPSHTWWGGQINNTYLKSLWNESFADWCGGFYGRNLAIGNKAERQTAFIEVPGVDPAAYDAAPLNDSPPDIGPASSTLGYGKGAFVLQMLEQEIGPDKMLKACQEWIRTQDKTRGGEWEDFEAVVQRVAGRDLKWFFDEWVRRPGYVIVDSMTANYANGHVDLTAQFKNGPWRITADVLLEYKDGTREIVKANNGEGNTWRVPAKEKPVLVSFDPWRRIVRVFHPDEQPTNVANFTGFARKYTDPKHPDWLPTFGGKAIDALPKDLANTFLVGSPETLPAMKPLCAKVGFTVAGNRLTYKGTTIDLNEGAAIAVVDLENGKRCAIGLGKVRNGPDLGQARLVVVDGLGHFLRGVTDPKTTGALTFKL